MMELVNLAFATIIISSMLISASSRLKNCLYTAAFQGMIVSVIPVAVGGLKPELIIVALAAVLIKGFVLPKMIMHSIREARVRREVEPKISYPLSILFSMIGLLVSLLLVSRMPVGRHQEITHLMIVTPLFMMYTGLFIMISRLKAITVVVGFLILGNSIYLFGALLCYRYSMVVELALGLDLLVGLYAHGVTKFSINRTFDHIDRGHLSGLVAGNEEEG